MPPFSLARRSFEERRIRLVPCRLSSSNRSVRRAADAGIDHRWFAWHREGVEEGGRLKFMLHGMVGSGMRKHPGTRPIRAGARCRTGL